MSRILANQRVVPRLPLQSPPSGPVALPPPVYRPRLSVLALGGLILAAAMVALGLAIALSKVASR